MTINCKGRLIDLKKPKVMGILNITPDEYEQIERLNDIIILEVNENDGYVNVSANMPEPIASAELTYRVEELLQKYLIDFKIKKSIEQLKFIEDRYEENQIKFLKAQRELANFIDRNQFVNSELAKSKLKKLESDYDLIYNVYNGLAKQLETQKITVKENTPVFTIIQPVSVPLEKFKPKRIMILIVYTFLGVFIGSGIELGKYFLSNFKKVNNN